MSNRLKEFLSKKVVRPVLERFPSRYNRLKRMKIYGVANFNRDDFRYWKQARRNTFTPRRIRDMQKEIETFQHKPLISVLMPVYNVDRDWLEEAIQSVLRQVYTNWQFCISDDASPSPHIKEVLEHYSKTDKRFKIIYLDSNHGISGSSNEALALATGDYAALLDHDDVLSRDAFFEVVKLINRHPDAGVVYSDEDKLTMSGLRLRPVRKPDWDPDLFLTHNYLCHLVVCRTELIRQAGGFRSPFDGSQDYDLLLRVTELTEKVYHIPEILYHWRMIPGSTAAIIDAKQEAFERTRKALRETVKRRGIDADVVDGDAPGTFVLKRKKNLPRTYTDKTRTKDY